ncbi:MAG: nucleotidyltransferase family protein [Pseudomonadota bacterium]|nr:nucleotidyltransferase family protein [Pseudomonadota bacterium]
MITGILLAAGAGKRFGGGKLQQLLPDGLAICVASVRNLAAAVNQVIAVVRPGDEATRALLSAQPNLHIVVCERAEQGMGHSLAAAVAASPIDANWVIALGDMPLIKPDTIRAVAAAIEQGAPFAMPVYGGQRGHPVGIHSRFRAALLTLEGDAGARAIIAKHERQIHLIETKDRGVLVDVDTVSDYQKLSI